MRLTEPFAEGGKNAIANISFSHLRWDFGFAVWCRRNFVPQRFPPACPRWKSICHIHDGHVHSRSVPCVYETPNEQCFRWRSGVLSCVNGMGNREAQGWGDRHFRLGRASGCIGGRNCHRDLWGTSGKNPDALNRWSSRWDVLFPWFHRFAFCRGGHSHACARRGFRYTSNRATPLAHVLFSVHCHWVIFPRTATSIPPLVTQNERTLSPGDPATDIADFLAAPCFVHRCVQENCLTLSN